MNRLAKMGAFSVALAVCFPFAVMPAEPHRATLTTAEVRKRLLAANARIRAWYVEYESARRFDSGQPTESYAHRIVAAKAPDYYFHWSSHGTPRYDWREDPQQQRFTLTPRRAIIERPFHRQFRLLSLAPDARLPGTMPGEFLFAALGWWPLPNRPSSPCVLPIVARARNYLVRAQQELVRGHWCHVLEYPGHDRLWLDGERGCAILERELFDPTSKLLRQRIESSEYQEIQPGIWAPFTFRNVLFAAARTPSQEGKTVKTLDAILHVREMRVNEQVPDNTFQFEPLPGSIQSMGEGRDERIEQVVPDGTQYLDDVLAFTKRQFDFPGVPPDDSGSAREALFEYGILGCGVVLVLGLFIRRCRSARNTPAKIVAESDPVVPKKTNT